MNFSMWQEFPKDKEVTRGTHDWDKKKCFYERKKSSIACINIFLLASMTYKNV